MPVNHLITADVPSVQPRWQRITAILLCATVVGGLLLACAIGGSTAVPTQPRWTCPTPTPRPFGATGPIKSTETYTDSNGLLQTRETYYTIWEQEYGRLGNPAPAPTVYIREGRGFLLGQIVNVLPALDAHVSVVSGSATRTSGAGDAEQLVTVQIRWMNRAGTIPFSAPQQVVVSAVTGTDGRLVGGPSTGADGWSWSAEAQVASGQATDPALLVGQIADGTTTMVIPLFVAVGTVQTVDIRVASPTGGDDGQLRMQWSAGSDPHCTLPGTESAVYVATPTTADAPNPPAGSSALVAWAYQQVGRPYCWGGKGFTPCSGCDAGSGCVTPSCTAQGGYPCWDCSGLAWGAYNSIGTSIRHGTSNQSQYPEIWRVGSAVDPATVVADGDLLLFGGINANGRANRITHVGVYDGQTGAMVHAASYPDGTVVAPRVMGNSYYRPRLVVITRPPIVR